ncbi:MAG: translation initiation factor IF-3 [bacterium]|nr:translation initiation factor IF-3 [bacterium]
MGFRRRRWREVAPEKDKIRVNRAIRVPEVRVVNEDGQQLGVMPTDAARDIAGRIGLDLVEISPNGQPPVCKIMDYGRYKYELQKKASSQKKTQHQSQLKEVKFRPRIDEHDLDFKLKNATRFLMDGDKVKATVMFRGREIVHQNIGRELLVRVTERLAEIAKPESRAQMEGRMLSMIFAPDRAAIDKLKQQQEAERGAEGGEEAAEDKSDKKARRSDRAPAEHAEAPLEVEETKSEEAEGA